MALNSHLIEVTVQSEIDSIEMLSGDQPEHSNDHAKAGMPLRSLEDILTDTRSEARWRREGDICSDYYDSNQLTPDIVEALEDAGIGPVFRNVIKPTVDAVLGIEERTRVDWNVVSDYDRCLPVAEALSLKLKEAERDSGADRAISDAYAMAVKSGFGAVEVSRASNPFDVPYRVQPIHRREIYWDPRSRKVDWSDARFVLRKRWFDLDVACLYFPEHAELLKYSVTGWASFDKWLNVTEGQAADMRSWMDAERITAIDDIEWRDSGRKRVCIYEVWYRTWKRGLVMELPDGRKIPYNMANPMHLALKESGQVPCREAVYDKLRLAYFAGPHRLADFESPRRKFPYVPFWAFREDLTGVPYGLIRSMVSVQDEINTRLFRMLWLLKSRRVMVDEDALSTMMGGHTRASKEFAQANGYIILNPGRRNASAVNVDENLALAESQRAAMQDAISAMPAVSGVYAPLLGQAGGVTAAAAIGRLVDQGTNTLAELNGNYIYSRRMVGELLLDLVKEDMTDKPWEGTIETSTGKKKVYVNKPIIDPATGIKGFENNVGAAAVRVTLAEVPATQSYRQQQFAQLAELVKSMPPDSQALLAPYLIEESDLPKRKEIAKLLRDKLGISVDSESPEGQAAKQQAEQVQMEQAKQLAAKFDADLAEQQARIERMRAESQEIKARTAQANPGQSIEVERKLMALEYKYKAETDKLTLELIAERAKSNASREDAQARAEIELGKQAADLDRARIQAEAEIEIARINDKSAEREAELKAQMQLMTDHINEAMASIKQESRGAGPSAEPSDG
jgi:hypothetical protein